MRVLVPPTENYGFFHFICDDAGNFHICGTRQVPQGGEPTADTCQYFMVGPDGRELYRSPEIEIEGHRLQHASIAHSGATIVLGVQDSAGSGWGFTEAARFDNRYVMSSSPNPNPTPTPGGGIANGSTVKLATPSEVVISFPDGLKGVISLV